MDITKFKTTKGVSIASSPLLSPAIQWMQREVENLSDDEFWAWAVTLYNKGFSEQQERSIEKRRQINKNLIPEDFGYIVKMTLEDIFMDNIEELEKRKIIVNINV